MGKKRTYTWEYKLQALELCKQPNPTMKSVAEELGVPYKTLVGYDSVSFGLALGCIAGTVEAPCRAESWVISGSIFC